MITLFVIDTMAQKGACCIDLECIDTIEENACHIIGGVWFLNEDCDAGFECPMEFPCGSYVVGDFNGSGKFNVADLVEYFNMIFIPRYPLLLCECPPGSGNFWHVRMVSQ